MTTVTHIPVLLEESIESLAIQKSDIIVDGTFGGGGHSKAIRDRYDSVSLLCIDLDEHAHVRFTSLFGRVSTHTTLFIQANFKDVDDILTKAERKNVDKVLLDLGTSTFQLLDDTRGFSFNSEVPLNMAFSVAGSHTGFNAHDIINTWGEESIADIIYAYGEETYARKIAKAIVKSRDIAPIATAKALGDLIAHVIKRKGRLHPATKTFQALRIAVNDELSTLKTALDAWWSVLNPGGRIVVITFHSLEDRIVKHWMKAQTDGTVLTKKPIVSNKEVLLANPRARSAKLRVISK